MSLPSSVPAIRMKVNNRWTKLPFEIEIENVKFKHSGAVTKATKGM